MSARYRKRPVEIEAVRFTGDNLDEVAAFLDSEIHGDADEYDEIEIETLEGVMVARPGDYVIKGIQGEAYPCRADIFDATYEPVR